MRDGADREIEMVLRPDHAEPADDVTELTAHLRVRPLLVDGREQRTVSDPGDPLGRDATATRDDVDERIIDGEDVVGEPP